MWYLSVSVVVGISCSFDLFRVARLIDSQLGPRL